MTMNNWFNAAASHAKLHIVQHKCTRSHCNFKIHIIDTYSQHSRLSSDVLEDSDNNGRSRFITSDMSGRETGSTDSIERISSSNAAQ